MSVLPLFFAFALLEPGCLISWFFVISSTLPSYLLYSDTSAKTTWKKAKARTFFPNSHTMLLQMFYERSHIYAELSLSYVRLHAPERLQQACADTAAVHAMSRTGIPTCMLQQYRRIWRIKWHAARYGIRTMAGMAEHLRSRKRFSLRNDLRRIK